MSISAPLGRFNFMLNKLSEIGAFAPICRSILAPPPKPILLCQIKMSHIVNLVHPNDGCLPRVHPSLIIGILRFVLRSPKLDSEPLSPLRPRRDS